MERITVVKIGGNVIDNPEALKRFLKEFAALEGPKILIHGGGKLATRLAERLELKNGRIMWPVRTALSGKAVTPGGAVELCQILGKDETLRRIRTGMEKLAQ